MNKIKTKLLIPNKLNVDVKGNKAKVEIYPFERGYGITLAHPIRRVLLASTVGYAPVAIKIGGISHEFDSIKGVFEDVATFIINLKNVRFKIKDSSKDEIEVNYTFVGPKELYGKDLNNDDVEVVVPDEYMITLNEDARLNFSLIIKKGMGFVPSENIRDDIPNGYIALDAFFSPIKNAIYEIENILVEDETDFEKVVFTIETDGQIAPDDALRDAVNKLFGQFAIFTEKFDLVQEVEFEETLDEKYKILTDSIDSLNLRSRSYNCLEKDGIKFIGELVLMGSNEIAKIKNLGKKSLDEITEKLDSLGFNLNEPLSENVKKLLQKEIEKLKDEA
jgi:DNA-directed RNA polymerase subunit alpha